MKSTITLADLDRRLRRLETQMAALLAGSPPAYSLNELLAELDLRIGQARVAGDLEHYRQLRAIRDKHS